MTPQVNLKQAIFCIFTLSLITTYALNYIFIREEPRQIRRKHFVEGKTSINHGFLGAIYFIANLSQPYSVSMITNNGTRESARHQIIGRFNDLEEAENVLDIAYHIHTQDKFLLPKSNVRLRGVHQKYIVNKTEHKHEDHLRTTI